MSFYNKDFLKEEIRLNPSTSYRIYKYLTEDAVQSVKDISIPPHSINYTIATEPKLKKVITFDKGFDVNVTYHVWDYTNNVSIEEVLKIESTYTQDNNNSMPSARDVLSRFKTRKWILEDGTYKIDNSDVKVTEKVYSTLIERNVEGERRRNNIFVALTQDYTTLLYILATSQDLVAAQSIGASLLSNITATSDYIKFGSQLILNQLDNITDTQYLLDTVIPNIAPIQGTVPLSIGLTVREYLKQKLRADI